MRIGLGLLLAATAWASQAAAQDPMATLHALAAKQPPPTLTARYGDDALRRGELRLPPGKGPFPVAILVHGGCWRADMETLSGLAPLAESLRKRGIATWNIEFRRVGDPGGGYPGTLQDVAAGVDHLAVLAKTQPLDMKRVAIIGHSSGAHLALWAASRPKLPAPWTSKGAVHPRTVVAIDGPGDLASLIGPDKAVCGAPAIVPFMGGTPKDKPEAYAIATPAQHLPLGLRQVLVEADLRPFMEGYEAAAKASGDPVDVLVPPDANHFDILTPGLPNGEAVADFIVAKAFAKTK